MISTGITYLDKITGGLKLGDNVVWQISDGISIDNFIKNFFNKKNNFNQNVIYINFNFSPNTICKKYAELFEKQHVILIDAFTNGKGNSDKVFLDFYNGKKQHNNSDFILLENPKDISLFIENLKTIEENNKEGSFYIFDSLTGMTELWKNESNVLDFFTYTCPKLYDLNTLAYWIYEKNAHSKEFIAGVSHVTQIVFSLYNTPEDFFEFSIQKLEGRSGFFSTSPHKFKFSNHDIQFQSKKPDNFFKIGDKVKILRKKNNKTQAELASLLGLTPGAVSQIENSIISPSLNTLVQLSAIFGKTPEYFVENVNTADKNINFKIYKRKQLNLDKNCIVSELIDNDDISIKIYSIIIKEDKMVEGPIMLHKGNEFLYITDGSLYLTVEGEEHKLNKGESVLLQKSFFEKWHNKDISQCEFIYMLL
ncbi:MAG: helix-turn-helix domain-containing protein [Spirochaetota bacterium]